MAIIDANEMFFTAFEPKQANRFILYADGIPTWMIKGVSAINLTQGEVVLNHINVLRKVKGKTVWGDVTMTLHDPISPSGAQVIMEWVRLSHESVTGRDGYSTMYKKDIQLRQLSPLGEIIEEWSLKNAFITETNFGTLDWSSEDVVNIEMTLRYDWALFSF